IRSRTFLPAWRPRRTFVEQTNNTPRLARTGVDGSISGTIEEANITSTLARTLAQASMAGPASQGTPLTVLHTILSNPTDLAFVNQYTTDEFTYVSLNYDNLKLKQVLPWTGTTKGTEGLVQAFIDVNRYWTVDDFQIHDSFENEDGAAIFGTFTYTSNTLGKSVTSP